MTLKQVLLSGAVSALAIANPLTSFADEIQVSGWHQLFDFSKEAVFLAIDKFEKKNEGTEVVLVDTAFGQALQQATVTTLAGNPSDAIQLVAGWVPAMAEIGGLASLNDLLTEDEINSIPQSSRDSLTFDGELLAIPWNPGPILVHFNRGLMAEAGLDPDAPPTTWGDLKDAAMKICALPDQDGGPIFGIALRTAQNPNSAQWSIPIIYGHGGDIVVDGEVSVDNDAVKAAMEWIKEIVQAECSPVGFSFGETRILFSQGRAGFIFEGPWGKGLVQNLSDGKMTVAPDGDVWVSQMPGAPDGSTRTIGNPIVISVSSKSDQAEKTLDFIRTALFDTEVTDAFFVSSGLLPTSNMDILTSGIVGESAYAQHFVTALPNTYDTPIKSSKFNAILSELSVGMQEIIAGGDTDEVLDNVRKRVEVVLSR